MQQGHIRPSETQARNGERSATLSLLGEERTLWFSSDAGSLETSNADSFLLGSLLMWMAAGVPVHVHGAVTRQLLANLDEWQAAWSSWRPERYRRVQITVDEVVDLHSPNDTTIAAFSGGVDACFTVRRHLTDAAGWQRANLRAVMLVHGFDVPLDQSRTFEQVRLRAMQTLGSTNLELITVRTNLRDLGQDWEDGVALALAACLNLLSSEFGVGLIGSSQPYSGLVLPWGSNPVTDHLTSTGTMSIRHDGAGCNRTDKVALLATWPEARDNLRVCWQGEELDRNCGLCEKCMRTILNFQALGETVPQAFSTTPSERQISKARLSHTAVIAEWRSLAEEARSRGIEERWVSAVDAAIFRNRVRGGLRSAKHRLQERLPL